MEFKVGDLVRVKTEVKGGKARVVNQNHHNYDRVGGLIRLTRIDGSDSTCKGERTWLPGEPEGNWLRIQDIQRAENPDWELIAKGLPAEDIALLSLTEFPFSCKISYAETQLPTVLKQPDAKQLLLVAAEKLEGARR